MLGGRRVSDGPWKRGLQNLLDSSPNRKGIRNNRKRGHSVQFPVSFLVHLEGSSAAGGTRAFQGGTCESSPFLDPQRPLVSGSQSVCSSFVPQACPRA